MKGERTSTVTDARDPRAGDLVVRLRPSVVVPTYGCAEQLGVERARGRVTRRTPRRFAGALLAALTLAGAGFVADWTVAPPAGADEVRSLEAFGAADSVTLNGTTATRSISVPFDEDAPPTWLSGTVEHGIGDGEGTLEARVDGERVALIPVSGAAAVPFAFDLRSRRPSGPEATTLDIELVSRFPRTDDYCSGRSTIPYVRIAGLTASFADSGARPESIATFFPPLLDRVVLWVPPRPTAVTADAVLRLTLGVVDRYRGQSVAVDVRELPAGGVPPAGHQTTVRHLVVGDRSVDHVVLADAPAPSEGLPATVLVLPSEGLVTAALGVLQDISTLAIGPAASYQQRVGDAVVPPLEQRLVDLGAPATLVTDQGRTAIELTVPQAAFGGMVTAYELRLDGRVLADDEVVVSVLVNDQLVDAHRTSGTFHRSVRFEAPPLARSTTIRIEADEVGEEGRCTGKDDPVSLQLDEDASLMATLGVTPRVSFQLVPQALLPVLDVVFSGYTPATLDAGAALVADLAAGVPRGLGVRVVPELDELVGSSRPGLVVWAGNASELRAAGLRVIPDAELSSLEVLDRRGDLPVGTPVAQIARLDGRHLVVVNAPDDTQLRTFAHLLVDHPSDLARFVGDVVVADGDQLRDVQLTVTPEAEQEREHLLPLPAKAWLVVCGGIALALAAAFGLRDVRSRRRRRAP